MARRRKLAVVLSVLAAAAMAVAGCSSSGGGGSSTGTSGSSGAAKGAVIKIGVICSCSGNAFGAFNAGARQVIQAWADSTNAAGGIKGHKVQLTLEDDQFNPSNALTDAKTVVADGVIEVADISALDTAFATTLQQASIPVIGAYSDAAPFFTNPDFYPQGETGNSINNAVMQIAKTAGAKNIGVLYCAEAPSCAQIAPGMTPIGAKINVPVDYKAEIAATAPNYTAQCVAAQQQHINTVFIGDDAPVELKVAANCGQQNYNPIYVLQGGATDESLFKGGLKDLNIQYADEPFFAKTPATQAFDAAMARYEPGLVTNGQLFIQNDWQAWISMQLLAQALTDGGLTASSKPTAAMVVKGLDSFKGETLGGLTPPLSYTPGQPHSIACWFTGVVKNGVPSVGNNGTYTCGS